MYNEVNIGRAFTDDIATCCWATAT